MILAAIEAKYFTDVYSLSKKNVQQLCEIFIFAQR